MSLHTGRFPDWPDGPGLLNLQSIGGRRSVKWRDAVLGRRGGAGAGMDPSS